MSLAYVAISLLERKVLIIDAACLAFASYHMGKAQHCASERRYIES